MSLKDAIREAVDERDKQGAPPIAPATLTATSAEPMPNPAKIEAKVLAPATPPAESAPNLRVPNTTSHKAVNTASSKAVTKAKRMPTETLRRPIAQEAVSSPENGHEVTAAMTVRVSRRHRLHWLISAKQEGTSLTAAITEALNARFGEPEGEQ